MRKHISLTLIDTDLSLKYHFIPIVYVHCFLENCFKKQSQKYFQFSTSANLIIL